MKYFASAVTDIGNTKKTNQDSVCVKIAQSEKYGQIAMVVLCDGMGGDVLSIHGQGLRCDSLLR